jgi:Tfp pilus assembly protein PilX
VLADTFSYLRARARIRFSGRKCERGLALVMAIGIMAVLLVSGTALTQYTFSNTRSSSASRQDGLAYAAAEAGMNDALSVLFNASDFHSSSSLPAVSNQVAGPDGEKYSYSATLVDPIWTITATGTAPNMTQGTKLDTRTVKQQIRITPAAAGGVSNTVWNYIYSDAPAGNCMNLSNNSTIGTPLYIRGDLCLSNNAGITRNNTFATNFASTPQLQVGGKITLGNNAFIGTSAARLNGVQTGVGCGSTPHNPCTTADNVWANQYLTSAPNSSKPVIDLATWYKDSAPGPKHACTSSTGTPPIFDNDTTQNGTAGTINLTPASNYDCKFTDATGNVLGEIAWNDATNVMTINGTLFYDGNLTFSQAVVYAGRATIYAAGTISLGGGSVCGIAGCTNSWDSTSNLMVLVAGSNAQSPSYAMNLSNNAQFQGAVECNGDFNESNNVGVWGSVIAHQVFLSNNASDTYVPFGTPVPGQPAQSGYTETLSIVPDSYGG